MGIGINPTLIRDNANINVIYVGDDGSLNGPLVDSNPSWTIDTTGLFSGSAEFAENLVDGGNMAYQQGDSVNISGGEIDNVNMEGVVIAGGEIDGPVLLQAWGIGLYDQTDFTSQALWCNGGTMYGGYGNWNIDNNANFSGQSAGLYDGTFSGDVLSYYNGQIQTLIGNIIIDFTNAAMNSTTGTWSINSDGSITCTGWSIDSSGNFSGNANTANSATTAGSATSASTAAAISGTNLVSNSGGVITKYNGTNTAGDGIPTILAILDTTLVATSITASTLVSTPAAGLYRISFSSKITTAATASSTLGGATGFQVVYTDPDGNVQTTGAIPNQTALSLTGNSLTTTYCGSITVYAKVSTNLQYAFGYTSSGATVMRYNLHITVEKI